MAKRPNVSRGTQMGPSLPTVSQGTQTDVYELYINGMSDPDQFITKDGYTFKFRNQSERISFYTCSSSSCKRMAYVIKRNGQVISRGPEHNHEKC